MTQPLTVEVLQRVSPGAGAVGYRGPSEAARVVLRVRWSAPGLARWLLPALAWLVIVPVWLWLRDLFERSGDLYHFLALGFLPVGGLWLLAQSVNRTKITLDGAGLRTWHGPFRIPLLDEVGGAFVPLHELVRFEVHRFQRVRIGAGNTIRTEEVFYLVAVHTADRVTRLTQSTRHPESYRWLAAYLQGPLDHVIARSASTPR